MDLDTFCSCHKTEYIIAEYRITAFGHTVVYAFDILCINHKNIIRTLLLRQTLVTGTKGAWAGEVEIMNGTFEFVEGGDTYIAKAFDATSLLGKDELIDHQNEFAVFKGMTVEKIEYKNGEPGDDIYVTLSKDGASYSFCIERYLTAPDTDVYKAVGELKTGDVIDVEGFIYWYEGVNTHITNVIK